MDGLLQGQGGSCRDEKGSGTCSSKGQGFKEELPVLTLTSANSDKSSGLVGLTLDDGAVAGGDVDGGKGKEEGKLDLVEMKGEIRIGLKEYENNCKD